MRIMYLLFSFTVGGTERLVSDICNKMAKINMDVFLYIVNDVYDQEMLDSLDKRVNVTLQGREAAGKEKISTLRKIAKYINANKIDVVHCNALNTPELIVMAKILNPKLKVFYTIHGMEQYKTLNKLKVLYRNIICRKIIAISESVKNDITNAGAKKSNVETIYNAIDFERFDEKAVCEHRFDINKIIIGNVARFMPKIKGQDILIDAIEKVKPYYPAVKCFFAGAPDVANISEFVRIQEDVKKRDLSDNIFFIGNINDIPSFLSKIDIFVLPSRFEGFGLSLVEAMSMGIPCIASRLNGPNEVLEYGKRGQLFEPEDSSDLAHKIVTMINAYEEEKKRALENKEMVREQYSINIMCERLIDLYKFE